MNYPSEYILKPQTNDYPCLPEAEHLGMRLADISGIKVVPFALLRAKDSSLMYITKRIDRVEKESLAMEDFCQLDGRLTEDKYKGSYEKCGRIIKKYSSRKGIDLAEIFYRIVFSYCIGNSDMHLKNFSLIEEKVLSGEYHLSKAYDLLTVNIANPADKDQMALTINGKKRNITKNDLIKLADSFGIEKKTALKIMARILSYESVYIEECRASYMSDELKDKMIELIKYRCSKLS